MEHKAEEASSAEEDRKQMKRRRMARCRKDRAERNLNRVMSQQTMKSYHAGGGQAPAQTKPESGQRGQTAPRQRPQGSKAETEAEASFTKTGFTWTVKTAGA